MKFTQNDAGLIVDALNGIRWSEGVSKVSHLQSNIACAIEQDNLAEKWNVDGLALASGLGNLTEDEASEILDKVKQFWDASPHDDLWGALVVHGLTVEED